MSFAAGPPIIAKPPKLPARVDCYKDVTNQKFATSGNRTRASRVAGENSTTEPTLLENE